MRYLLRRYPWARPLFGGLHNASAPSRAPSACLGVSQLQDHGVEPWLVRPRFCACAMCPILRTHCLTFTRHRPHNSPGCAIDRSSRWNGLIFWTLLRYLLQSLLPQGSSSHLPNRDTARTDSLVCRLCLARTRSESGCRAKVLPLAVVSATMEILLP